MKSNFKWIILFAAILLACAAWIFLQHSASHKTAAAIIRQDGEIIKVISLSDIKEPYELTVTSSGGGFNLIHVENGRIAVTDADCPDRICVNQGFIHDGGIPIVCLPHKLSITVEGAERELDAVSGGN